MISHILQTYGYFGLFIALALEYVFVPVPGETTLTAIGILWQSHKYGLRLFWLLLATTGGTFTGSLVAYLIGRLVGRPFVERFGRLIRLTPDRIDRAETLFHKYTVPTLVVSRFIAVVRILVPYIAGINRVPLWVFVPVMLVSSLAWTATFILAGTAIERAWHQVLHHWRQELAPAVIIVCALAVGYYYFHRWLHHRIEKASASEGTAIPPEQAEENAAEEAEDEAARR
ncbi:MAG: DedA family protein [Thermoflavifilum sp.]|nr:DedA family protein [Thermoflavifilum sp.]MCL6512788.1 DedA family protein [Alicyclobacillus sp.]